MAAANPTGMGNQTSRQFRRVAGNIRKYANSVQEYNEMNPGENQWYDSHATIRNGAEKHVAKLYPTQAPIFKPAPVAKPSPLTIGRRDRRKTFQ